jgi:hypothetical protein
MGVSKTWHQLAEPCLYHNIWLTSGRSAKALARLLLESDIFSHAAHRALSIRHIHISTSPLNRCDPADIIAIVRYARYLRSCSDSTGMRRTRAGFGTSPPYVDPQTSPEAFAEWLGTLLWLQALAWTTYDDGPIETALTPILRGVVGQNLRFLELNVCSAFDAIYNPDPDPLRFAPDPAAGVVCLPRLESVRACSDTGALHTLAGWDLPALHSVAIVASDYSYASTAFAGFLASHGDRILHLELGHSTAEVSLVTCRRPRLHTATINGIVVIEEVPDIDLAELVPHLETLVCNADAEWRWQDPDWIAPHVLLPAHPTIQRIAIRGIDARICHRNPNADVDHLPLFPLAQQLDTLCLKKHFPSLQAIQDLSPAVYDFKRNPGSIPDKVRRFWMKVLKSCESGEVRFEDCFQTHCPPPVLYP